VEEDRLTSAASVLPPAPNGERHVAAPMGSAPNAASMTRVRADVMKEVD